MEGDMNYGKIKCERIKRRTDGRRAVYIKSNRRAKVFLEGKYENKVVGNAGKDGKRF